MKGTVVNCMEELVKSKFGTDKWRLSLKKAGQSEFRLFSGLEDVPDGEILGLMKSIGEVLSFSAAQVMAAFGEHWATIFAPKLYKPYFDRAKSTREFLVMLDEIHVNMTRTIVSAKPPRFTYEWQGDKHLIMHYQSSRGLVALMPGLIAGLGKYYRDKPQVQVVGNAVHVVFA